MSKDAEVKEVIELIKALNLQQASLISRLERLSAERREEITPIPAQRAAAPNIIAPREFRIGDEVRILNPRRFQAQKGKIIKISDKRITVKAPNGSTVLRAPKNIAAYKNE